MAGRVKFIVSDLHLGAGCAPDNPLEDFTVDQQFAAFLADIAAEGQDVELIVNGDMIEFLQVPAVDAFDPQAVYPAERYRDSSQDAALKKIGLVIAGHPAFFAALRDFLRPQSPRRTVTIIKGNHDVELYWDAVQQRIRQAVGAVNLRRDLLTFAPRSISRDGLYVEHGNQYAEPLNRFENFDDPRDPQEPEKLVTVAGSRFVISFVNEVEREKWWVDAVKPIPALIWYGFAIDFAFAAKALAHFLRALPAVVIGGFAVEAGRAASELAQQLADESAVAALAERYRADADFRNAFDARVAQALSPGSPAFAPSGSDRQGGALERGRDVAAEMDRALRKAAQAKIAQERAEVVVFGHTHEALTVPLEGGTYINSGTWVWWRDFAGSDLATWKAFYAHPEAFAQPHHLHVVRVDYDAQGHPHASLLDLGGSLLHSTAPARKGCAAWWARLMGALKRSA